MPKPPQMPTLPNFDLPVSVVVVRWAAHRLMVGNVTPQLGEFFGVKGGNGVLVRSVKKAVAAKRLDSVPAMWSSRTTTSPCTIPLTSRMLCGHRRPRGGRDRYAGEERAEPDPDSSPEEGSRQPAGKQFSTFPTSRPRPSRHSTGPEMRLLASLRPSWRKCSRHCH